MNASRLEFRHAGQRTVHHSRQHYLFNSPTTLFNHSATYPTSFIPVALTLTMPVVSGHVAKLKSNTHGQTPAESATHSTADSPLEAYLCLICYCFVGMV
jgi:hypothetical protein